MMGMSGWIKVGSMYGVWDGKMDGSMHILFSQFCIGFFCLLFLFTVDRIVRYPI